MALIIKSKDNRNIKMVRQLAKKSFRHETRKFVAEGRKLVLEATVFAPDDICFVVMDEGFFKRETAAVQSIEKVCSDVYVVPESVFSSISDTDTPQGVLAVVNMREEKEYKAEKLKEVLVLDGVSEPGNMGTIIRTAEALGYDAVYIMKGSADLYSPKTVRSTMGSVFRMNFKRDCTVSDIRELQEEGFSLIATTPSGEVSLETFKAPERIAVVIGNEAHGVSDEILNFADQRVKITMDGMAESLNAAVASGIVMHWLKAYGIRLPSA